MKQKRVLIADDSPTIVKMLTYMLATLPCDVVVANDGVEAIKLAYNAHPDLVLLDILMPKMNGYQVCRLLKDDETTKHIPIVILTAKDQQSDRFWGMATGADEYIVKDFQSDLLIETVKRYLAKEAPQVKSTAERKLKEITTIDVLSHANHLLDRQLYQSTITNKISQLASSIQNFEETIFSVFELLRRVITYQIGAISVLGTQATRLRLYFYITDVVSSSMFTHTKQLLLSEFSKISSVKDIDVNILHGSVNEQSERELKSVCEGLLIGRSKKIGTIVLGDSRKGRFSDEDRETFRMIVTEAAIVIDNARLYDENARMHEDLERELWKAYDIQKMMLPQDNPIASSLTIEATSIPAKEVGGDYYDYFKLNDHQLLLTIGDVTGKGVPAALMMTTIKTALQIRIESTLDVRKIMSSLNTLVCEQATKQYMTLFLGIIDTKSRTLTYCNAGHNFPCIISPNKETLNYLEETSLPLGFIKGSTYNSHAYNFEKDDILFFYTDGIVEAMNEKRELFGYPQLENLLLTYCHEDLLSINVRILEHVEAFCHETPQDDDMTIVLLQAKPKPSSERITVNNGS